MALAGAVGRIRKCACPRASGLARVAFDVEIVDYCVSSCANYVFVAARTKRVLPGGAVAWHGNALQHDAVAQVDDMFSKPRTGRRLVPTWRRCDRSRRRSSRASA